MEFVTIEIPQSEVGEFEKLLKEKNLHYQSGKEKGFLPKPVKEIIIVLTQVLISVLQEHLRRRKGRSEIIIRTPDASMRLNATNVEHLVLLIHENLKRQKGSKMSVEVDRDDTVK